MAPPPLIKSGDPVRRADPVARRGERLPARRRGDQPRAARRARPRAVRGPRPSPKASSRRQWGRGDWRRREASHENRDRDHARRGWSPRRARGARPRRQRAEKRARRRVAADSARVVALGPHPLRERRHLTVVVDEQTRRSACASPATRNRFRPKRRQARRRHEHRRRHRHEQQTATGAGFFHAGPAARAAPLTAALSVRVIRSRRAASAHIEGGSARGLGRWTAAGRSRFHRRGRPEDVDPARTQMLLEPHRRSQRSHIQRGKEDRSADGHRRARSSRCCGRERASDVSSRRSPPRPWTLATSAAGRDAHHRRSDGRTPATSRAGWSATGSSSALDGTGDARSSAAARRRRPRAHW